jgi:hypothetical protein
LSPKEKARSYNHVWRQATLLRGRTEDVPTLGSVPKTRVLHVRVEPAELAVWRVTAASRGRTLSGLVRELLAAAASECVTQAEEGSGSWLPPTGKLSGAHARGEARGDREGCGRLGLLAYGRPGLLARPRVREPEELGFDAGEARSFYPDLLPGCTAATRLSVCLQAQRGWEEEGGDASDPMHRCHARAHPHGPICAGPR